MRILLVAIFTFLAFTRCFSQDFAIAVNLTEGEKSKDSHSKTTNILINSRKIFYDENYYGTGAGTEPSVPLEYKLKPEDFLTIKASADSLLVNPTNDISSEIGMGNYINISFSIMTKEDKKDFRITGMTSQIEGDPGYARLMGFIGVVKNILHSYGKQ